jgi:ribosome biogenesis GTPase
VTGERPSGRGAASGRRLDAVEARIAEAEAVAIGVAVLAVSAATGRGVDELRGFLAGNRTAALLGPSGSGKSTLVNRLLGREAQATGAVRSDGRGRHTTTARELFLVPSGGLLLDTPGLRVLQLWQDDGIGSTFADIDELAARCRFSDCRHDSEPGCAVARHSRRASSIRAGSTASRSWRASSPTSSARATSGRSRRSGGAGV